MRVRGFADVDFLSGQWWTDCRGARRRWLLTLGKIGVSAGSLSDLRKHWPVSMLTFSVLYPQLRGRVSSNTNTPEGNVEMINPTSLEEAVLPAFCALELGIFAMRKVMPGCFAGWHLRGEIRWWCCAPVKTCSRCAWTSCQQGAFTCTSTKCTGTTYWKTSQQHPWCKCFWAGREDKLPAVLGMSQVLLKWNVSWSTSDETVHVAKYGIQWDLIYMISFFFSF